jgi:hypothetical protein
MLQGPGAANVSPLLAMVPMTYGQTINSLGAASPPPSASPYGPISSPIGTSINSQQQILDMLNQQQMMTPFPSTSGWGNPYGGGSYG